MTTRHNTRQNLSTAPPIPSLKKQAILLDYFKAADQEQNHNPVNERNMDGVADYVESCMLDKQEWKSDYNLLIS